MTGHLRLRRFDLLFPSYLLLACLALWVGGGHWLGEWQWTFNNVDGIMSLLGPYAAGVAAWRVTDAEANAALYATTMRGWAVPLRAGIRVWAYCTIAWLVAGLTAVTGTAVGVHGGPAPVWVLLAAPMILAACISAGMAVGHLWPGRVGAILVVPALFLLGGLGAGGALPDLLRQGPGTSSLAGLRWDPAHFLWGIVALMLIAATCVLLSSRRRDLATMADLAAPVATSAALVAALLTAHATAPHRFEPSDEQPTVCTASSPAVCVAPSNARALASLSELFNRYVPAARRLGLVMPSSFREVLPNHHGDAPWGDLNLGSHANDHGTIEEVLTALVTPGDCRAYYDPAGAPSSDVYQAQNMLAAMVSRVHAGGSGDLQSPALLAWARITYEDLHACRLGAIRPFARTR